jgi:hypothetical protein
LARWRESKVVSVWYVYVEVDDDEELEREDREDP